MRSDAHDDLVAIILVGGRSSRMGRPKPWLDLGGQPLLAHVVARVQPWVREIVLVAAPDQALPALGDTLVPVTVVHDDRPGEGPLPALACGLATVTQEWALTLACDAPFVAPRVVAHLAHMRAADVEAIVPEWNGRVQPLVALYRRRFAAAVVDLVGRGERRMHALATLPGVRIIAEDVLRSLDPDGASFRALNTPEEYAAAVAAYAKPS
jgi:molybdopterin-guanine dinucleotide biosynthesis protein A